MTKPPESCPQCNSGPDGLPSQQGVDKDGNVTFTTIYRCGTVSKSSETVGMDGSTITETMVVNTDLCRKMRNVNLDTTNKDLTAQLELQRSCPKCNKPSDSKRYICETCANQMGTENHMLCKALAGIAVRYIADSYAPLPKGRVLATAPEALQEAIGLVREFYVVRDGDTDQLKAIEDLIVKAWK